MEEYRRCFEVESREAGSERERAYFAIRQASKDAWRMLHAEDYEGPVMQGRIRIWFDAGRET